MRLDGPGSSNFEDRTGQGSGGFPVLGGGGGLLGLLIPLVLSRLGFVGLLILALGYCALGGLGSGGLPGGAPTQQAGSQGGSATTLSEQDRQLLNSALIST